MTSRASEPRLQLPRVAVIGCGYWGRNLVRNMANLGALAAVADADQSLARETSTAFEVPAMSVDAILADNSIRAVVIATPAMTHASLGHRALAAGKNLLVEKPLALEVAEAQSLERTAQSSGLTLMVGHLLQYHPAYLRLRSLVQEGQLGRLQYVYSNRLNLGRFRREENILWSFAPHDISMILGLFGQEPDSVTATGSYFLHPQIADVTTTHLTFPGGEAAHVFVSWLHPNKEQRLVVIGDSGMAVFDDGVGWNEKLSLYPHSVSWREGVPQPDRAKATFVGLDEGEPLKLECLHFLESVRDSVTPRTDGAEGVRVLRVLAAAQASLDRPALASSTVKSAEERGSFVHESSYVDDGVTIGSGTKIWHFSHILSESRVGRDCNVGQNVMIGPRVTVGDRCKVQNNVSIYEGVELEDGVFCGPSCVFTNVKNPRAEVSRSDEFRPTLVRQGATIGANATIVCGVEIGAYAFIGAGALVAADVPAHALMVGVPARRIGWMSHAGERLDDDLVCPRTGAQYRVEDERLVLLPT